MINDDIIGAQRYAKNEAEYTASLLEYRNKRNNLIKKIKAFKSNKYVDIVRKGVVDKLYPCNWSDLLQCVKIDNKEIKDMKEYINQDMTSSGGSGKNNNIFCTCRDYSNLWFTHSTCKLKNYDNIDDLTFFVKNTDKSLRNKIKFDSTITIDKNIYILVAVLSLDKIDNKYITYAIRKSNSRTKYSWYKLKGSEYEKISITNIKKNIKDGLIFLYTKEDKIYHILDILPTLTDNSNINNMISEIENEEKVGNMSKNRQNINKYFRISLIHFIITSYSFYYKLDIKLFENLLDNLKNNNYNLKHQNKLKDYIKDAITKNMNTSKNINFFIYDDIVNEKYYKCKKCKKRSYKVNKSNMIYIDN